MSFTQHLQDASAIALSAKTQAIISFALCGFANFGSIAILVGGLAVIASQRRAEVAKLGPLALLAGTLANLINRGVRKSLSWPQHRHAQRHGQPESAKGLRAAAARLHPRAAQ